MNKPNYYQYFKLALIFVASLGLNGCGSNDKVGFSRSLPDEFAIISLPPLSLPPNYNLLPPNSESKGENDKQSLQGNLRASLLLKDSQRAPLTTSDKAFLTAAKAGERDEDIYRNLQEDNKSAISEPLSIAEAIVLEKSFDDNVRTFFLIKSRKKPRITQQN